MPIINFASLEQVPESLRSFAKQGENGIEVNVVPFQKIEEFRDANIRLVKEKDALHARNEALRNLVKEVVDIRAIEADVTRLTGILDLVA